MVKQTCFVESSVTHSSIQSLSHVRLFATPWTAAYRSSLSITNSWSLLKFMFIESVILSKHLSLCHPLFLLPSIFPSIWVFSNESVLCIRWLRYWSFRFSISPFNEYSILIFFLGLTGLISFQGTLKSLLQHYSSKASILCRSDFFIVQLSHPKMTTGKTIALAKWTFVGKVMSLLSNMLSRLVIAFLPRSVSFGFMTTVTICSNFGAQEHKVCHCFHFSPSICHEVMGTNAMILVILTLSFKPAFSLSSFTLIHRLFPWNVQEIVYLEKKLILFTAHFSAFYAFFFSEFCLFSLF